VPEKFLTEILLGIGALLFGIVGWLSVRLHQKVDNLDEDVREMPFRYVLKRDFETFVGKIEMKLDQILDKLDNKADKTDIDTSIRYKYHNYEDFKKDDNGHE
jgi:hypothetical protein